MSQAYSKDHIPVIYLLRGLAAFMVMLFHFVGWGDYSGNFYSSNEVLPLFTSHGNMGVYIFFVISGFVIPYSLIIRNYRLNSFFQFILKRSVRIEIPYISSMIIGLSVLYLFHVYFHFGFNVTCSRTILHFFYLIPFTDHSWYNVIYWTLGVEFQFYLVIALLFPLLSSRNVFIRMFSLIVFAGCNLIHLTKPDFSFIYSHTALFCIGIVSSLYYLRRIRWTEWLVMISLCFFLSWYVKGLEISIFGLITAMVIVFIKSKTQLGYFMGKISYSLYLTHTLVSNSLIYLLVEEWHVKLSRHLILAICLIIAIVFAWGFWYLIERPSQKLASRLGKQL